MCVALALVMPCQVCKGWAVGHWSIFPQLYGVNRVVMLHRSGVLRSHEIRPSRFPVWGRVNFWGQCDGWVLLCSEECHNRYIQDPEEVILESEVNMFLWSSPPLPKSYESHEYHEFIFHLICVINIFSRIKCWIFVHLIMTMKISSWPTIRIRTFNEVTAAPRGRPRAFFVILICKY